MPEDLKFPAGWDSSGDIEKVDGDDFYYQHAQILGLIVAWDQRGSAMTANDIISFEDELGSIYAESPYFDTPIQVNVVSVLDEKLEVEISASNLSTFEITV